MNAIETIHLTKTYREVTAVDDLSLSVRHGELFALLGVNGAGKTTTIKMLCGLTRPTAGNAFLEGYSITHDTANIKKIIGVSPQETAVAPNLTVKENLELIGGIHGLSRAETRQREAALTAQFGLQEVRHRPAGKLSGGWQRRLSIAMALISEPHILFLDEPTLGLDVIARSELWDVLRRLKGQVTIILTTHYMEEAQALSDRIGIMKHGRLMALGTARELMEQTDTATFEQAFIAIAKEESR